MEINPKKRISGWFDGASDAPKAAEQEQTPSGLNVADDLAKISKRDCKPRTHLGDDLSFFLSLGFAGRSPVYRHDACEDEFSAVFAKAATARDYLAIAKRADEVQAPGEIRKKALTEAVERCHGDLQLMAEISKLRPGEALEQKMLQQINGFETVLSLMGQEAFSLSAVSDRAIELAATLDQKLAIKARADQLGDFRGTTYQQGVMEKMARHTTDFAELGRLAKVFKGHYEGYGSVFIERGVERAKSFDDLKVLAGLPATASEVETFRAISKPPLKRILEKAIGLTKNPDTLVAIAQSANFANLETQALTKAAGATKERAALEKLLEVAHQLKNPEAISVLEAVLAHAQ